MILIPRNGHDGRYKKMKQRLKEASLEEHDQHQGILDVFDYCLSEEEAREIIIPYEYHLKHENKFISFFKDMFSKYTCTVYFNNPIKKLNKEEKNRLGDVDFTIYKKLLKKQPGCVIVENIEELILLVKLSVLEISFVDYIFGQGEVVVQGNFDLSFPIYFQQDVVTKMVFNNRLFIRT